MADKNFRDYWGNARDALTVLEGEYYPDYLDDATTLFTPVNQRFLELLTDAASSADLLRLIMDEPAIGRIQLLRVFRRYVSPDTSVEMLKRKGKLEEVIQGFGERFRKRDEVLTSITARGTADEALAAIMYEYQTRGQKGYVLTESFFAWFQTKFQDKLTIKGPTGAGADVLLNKVLEDYPVATPADIVIFDEGGKPLVVGFARYDSDRGGAQEDDRTRGNNESAGRILDYSDSKGLRLKVLFLNDGPGLLLGSMWRDYSDLEERWPGRVLVATLKMLDERVTYEWITA